VAQSAAAAVAVVAVAALALAGCDSGGESPGPAHRPQSPPAFVLHADFKRVPANLGPGTPVRIAGIDVGKVARVSRGPRQTVLTLSIDHPSGWLVGTDAEIAIRPRIFVEGTWFLDLEPRTTKLPLPSGGTIPASQTRTQYPCTSQACTRAVERALRSPEARRFLKKYRSRDGD
jgi:ABC-type transporter Mla subunit MlaD